MKQLVLNIKDNKLQFFLELIKNFDFVSVEDKADWYTTLTAEEKKSIEAGLDDLENGRVKSHEEVMESVQSKLQSLRHR